MIDLSPSPSPAPHDAAEDCSALLDGAIDREATGRLLRRLGRDPELRRRFARYALIGSALKGQLTDLDLDVRLAERVMTRLPPEPVRRAEPFGRRGLPWVMAGGLAVAVFTTFVIRGSVTLPPLGLGARPASGALVPGRQVRLASYGAPGRATWRHGPAAERRVLDEYLLTHLAAPGYAPVMVHARLATYEVTLAAHGPHAGRP
jgi:hypothetical protein